MELNRINQRLNRVRKGAYTSVMWERPMKTRKGCADTIVKRTEAVARFGIEYGHMKAVTHTPESLPWGEWLNYPYTIKHNGNVYVRIYPQSVKSRYFKNGVEVKKADIIASCLKSEFREDDEKPLTITVKADNILAIG